MHFKDSYTNVSNSPSTLLLRRGGSALLWAFTLKRGTFLQPWSPSRADSPRLCQVQRRASIFVSLFLVLYRQPHLLSREAFLSRWPLCWPLTNALPLCVGVPVTSAEHAYLFLHLFLFFLNKKSQIFSVPQLNESMNSFKIPPPYILLYLNRFVMCIAYFSFLLWFLFRGFLKLFSPTSGLWCFCDCFIVITGSGCWWRCSVQPLLLLWCDMFKYILFFLF